MKCKRVRIALAGGGYNNGGNAGLCAFNGNNWNAGNNNRNGSGRVAFLEGYKVEHQVVELETYL